MFVRLKFIFLTNEKAYMNKNNNFEFQCELFLVLSVLCNLANKQPLFLAFWHFGLLKGCYQKKVKAVIHVPQIFCEIYIYFPIVYY